MMVTTEKEPYRFYFQGEVTDWHTFKAAYDAGNISDELYYERLALRQTWLDGHEVNERAWARAELAATDFMELPTATYQGERLVTSPKLAEILAYREAVRRYDLREEFRPLRPAWFVDESL
ncbi:hypothetical protein FLM06_03760 [Vibrio cholerae]|uniref:hypothetical protein n=1 Tax=Vibrio cholerae TaxID=666 RepID=UPI00115981E1|nr:hypothetical protein [Vibrio cholerae]TQO85250.1 hypothetical protein FLM06_03760 [Vibrio cholerae]TQP08618.1 hypothetical protein FLM03_16375 [Vibrio cholerae]TQP44526.1 hypothetical protein FLL99_14080 [Vibrio cholerae]TQQ48216.1 hypothetical protein FLL79_14400 [Vibrio cholerae]TQQ64424.1 hypothetical protein FLL83_08220 [Vibrio cholerae]